MVSTSAQTLVNIDNLRIVGGGVKIMESSIYQSWVGILRQSYCIVPVYYIRGGVLGHKPKKMNSTCVLYSSCWS